MTQGDFEEERDRSYRELASRLSEAPGLVESLPDQERRIAQGVVEGRKPYEIAMLEGISADAVWNIVRSLSNATMATGQPTRSRGYETGGLGADTDPGVTGGYGDTGFGAIGNEPPMPVTEEPPAQEPEETE